MPCSSKVGASGGQDRRSCCLRVWQAQHQLSEKFGQRTGYGVSVSRYGSLLAQFTGPSWIRRPAAAHWHPDRIEMLDYLVNLVSRLGDWS